MTSVQDETTGTEKSVNYIVVASVMTVMFLAAIENMITSTILPSVILFFLSHWPWRIAEH